MTGVHSDTKLHTGVHPDTQVHTGVHPDTQVHFNDTSSQIHLTYSRMTR